MKKERYNIKIIGHSKIDDHIEYIINAENNGINFTFTERYSDLRNLSELMRKSTNKPTFPKFPPKKFFGGDDEKFLAKRQQELNVFFDGLCSSKDFINLPSFAKFIETCKKTMKENKVAVEKKEEKKNTNILKKRMSERITIDKFRSKFKPEKGINKRLTREETKILENEFDSVVDSFKKKLIPIDFMVELNPNPKNESEYEKVIKEDNNLGSGEIKEDIEPGSDDNFNLVSETNENFDNIEKEINEKMEAIINKKKEIEKIYDINEIMKIL
jgi:hypothetical protein